MLAAFIKAWWPVVAVAASGLMGFSSMQTDMRHVQDQVKALETDHDVLVRVDERQKTMSEDMKSMKEDVKVIAEAVK